MTNYIVNHIGGQIWRIFQDSGRLSKVRPVERVDNYYAGEGEVGREGRIVRFYELNGSKFKVLRSVVSKLDVTV